MSDVAGKVLEQGTRIKALALNEAADQKQTMNAFSAQEDNEWKIYVLK